MASAASPAKIRTPRNVPIPCLPIVSLFYVLPPRGNNPFEFPRWYTFAMLFDSHAHLDDEAFHADLDQVLARAREAGVERILTVGTDPESSARALRIV